MKQPAPDEAAREKALKAAQALFKAEWDRAQTPAEKKTLASNSCSGPANAKRQRGQVRAVQPRPRRGRGGRRLARSRRPSTAWPRRSSSTVSTWPAAFWPLGPGGRKTRPNAASWWKRSSPGRRSRRRGGARRGRALCQAGDLRGGQGPQQGVSAVGPRLQTAVVRGRPDHGSPERPGRWPPIPTTRTPIWSSAGSSVLPRATGERGCHCFPAAARRGSRRSPIGSCPSRLPSPLAGEGPGVRGPLPIQNPKSKI